MCISSEWFHNVAVGISALLVPILGFAGFRQWRRELHGKTKFDIARMAIRYVDELQMSVHELRSMEPFGLTHSEWCETDEPFEAAIPDAYVRIYEKQIDSINKNLINLLSLRSDICALFKLPQYLQWLEELRDQVSALGRAVSLYFGLSRLICEEYGREEAIKSKTAFERDEKIIFASDSGDEYGNKFNQLIDNIMDALKKETQS